MAKIRARFLQSLISSSLIAIMVFITVFLLSFSSVFVSADRKSLKLEGFSRFNATEHEEVQLNYFLKRRSLLWKSQHSDYPHFWPAMKFGWRIVVGSIIGFIAAAFGSVGGVGGGGIYVPMLTLIIGFDAKSSVPISKCMVMGAAASTVYYNLKRRHPALDMPIIDYNLTLLIQPMLMLGISIGVGLSVILADWMVTILLIILFIGASTMSFFKGVEAWRTETKFKKFQEAAKLLESNGIDGEELELKPLTSDPSNGTQAETNAVVPILENVYWKELGLLIFVWVAFLVIQIAKNNTATCSTAYWVLYSIQIPVSVGVALYESVGLYKGTKVIASMGEASTKWKVHKLILYCFLGVLAGMVGGLLGLGGGFILGPLFLELGLPPQVSSATATFAMTFSSSMSVIEFYLLKRFPVPYALYFLGVATVAAFVGQHVVRKMIIVSGRASLIIFFLVLTIFVSAILLGGIGIANMIGKIKHNEYMGFENLCSYYA